jgi:hypothetical protein
MHQIVIKMLPEVCAIQSIAQMQQQTPRPLIKHEKPVLYQHKLECIDYLKNATCWCKMNIETIEHLVSLIWKGCHILYRTKQIQCYRNIIEVISNFYLGQSYVLHTIRYGWYLVLFTFDKEDAYLLLINLILETGNSLLWVCLL